MYTDVVFFLWYQILILFFIYTLTSILIINTNCNVPITSFDVVLNCNVWVRINEFAAVQIDAKLTPLFARQTLSRPLLCNLENYTQPFSIRRRCAFHGKRDVSSLLNTSIARRPFKENLCGSSVQINDSHVSLFFFTCHYMRITNGSLASIDRCFSMANDILRHPSSIL